VSGDVSGKGSGDVADTRRIVVVGRRPTDDLGTERGHVMPKMKTHKATVKRFKITGKG
jgi:hypothetical protein